MRVIMIGAGGHGKVCAEIASMSGYDEILFLDDNTQLVFCGKYNVFGIVKDFPKFLDGATNFFVSIGDAAVRQEIQEKIEENGGRVATLIHPDAVIGSDVEIGRGSVVMAGTVINSGTEIGKSVIVNTSSSVDHDCIIGDYCHVAVGAHICGTVTIGTGTWIGAGAVVSNNVEIQGNCMIGAGAVVVGDLKEAGVYLGIPAEKRRI